MPKKNLVSDNPVNNIMPFLSTVQVDQNSNDILNTNKYNKSTPIGNRNIIGKNGKELKRKRFNPLLLNSLFEDIEKIAYVENISINEAVNRAISLYRDTKRDLLEKYEEIERLKK